LREIYHEGKITSVRCRNHPRDIEYVQNKYKDYDLIEATTYDDGLSYVTYMLIPR
jgi:hypothetical protein